MMAWFTQYNDPYPNVTLDSELFDLTEEIYATHQKYRIAASFKQHVKGHQDNSTESKNLPLPAQFNVKADHTHLASSFY